MATMKPAYLAAGEDSTKRKVAYERLVSKLDEGVRDFNLELLDAENLTPEALNVALTTLPFAAPFRIVYVTHAEKITGPLADVVADFTEQASKAQEAQSLQSDQTAQAAQSSQADPTPQSSETTQATGPQIIALFDTAILDKRTKLYKAIASLGKESVISCSAAKAWEMPAYAARRAKEYGILLNQDVAKLLVERVGESPEAIANALIRLSSSFPGASITKEQVSDTIPLTRVAKPWEIVDALCDQRGAQALVQLKNLETSDRLAFHHFYTERIRELLCTRDVLKSGGYASADVIALAYYGEDSGSAQRLGWKFKNHARWLSQYSLEQLKRALYEAERAESALKGTGDEETALLRMAAALLV